VKTDSSTFRFGFICDRHNQGKVLQLVLIFFLALNINNIFDTPLRNSNYSVFKLLNPFSLFSEITIFEDMFSRQNKIKQVNMEIDSTMQQYAVQRLVDSLKERTPKKTEEPPKKNPPMTSTKKASNGAQLADQPSGMKTDEKYYNDILKKSGGTKRSRSTKSRSKKENDKPKSSVAAKLNLEEEKHEEPSQSTENVSSIISSRAKRDPDSTTYGLRGEIKQNSKLEFDKKIYEVTHPKKHKDRDRVDYPRTADE